MSSHWACLFFKLKLKSNCCLSFKILDIFSVWNRLITSFNLFSCCRTGQSCKWGKGRRYKGAFCEASCVLDSVLYYCHSIFSSTKWCNWVWASNHLYDFLKFELQDELWVRLGRDIFDPLLCCNLGPRWEIWQRKSMEKFQPGTPNPTHGPCWTLVSVFFLALQISLQTNFYYGCACVLASN